MRRSLVVAMALAGLLVGPGSSTLWAKGTRGGTHAKPAKPPHVKTEKPKHTPPVARTSAPRDSNGRIQRSAAARHAFARQTSYPNGQPGYVIDHIKPLACGRADTPSNMQWQTIAAAKVKDRVERTGCR